MAQGDIMAPPVTRAAAPKAKMTIYFALLIISLVAMLIGCLFMYLEIRRYGGFGTIRGTISAVEKRGRTVVAATQTSESVDLA
jgi:uncharacterized membrane protein